MAALETTSDPRAPHWRAGLPQLASGRVALRELRLSDAPTLHAVTCAPEVARHTWPQPPSLPEFEKFIRWTWAERAAGKYVCFGIVPPGAVHAAGLFELRQMQPRFYRAELGFLLEPAWWGTGVFADSLQLMLHFTFNVIGVRRLEARSSVDNHRCGAALRKAGARQEGTLRAAFVSNGQHIDQHLWSIVAGIDFPLTER